MERWSGCQALEGQSQEVRWGRPSLSSRNFCSTQGCCSWPPGGEGDTQPLLVHLPTDRSQPQRKRALFPASRGARRGREDLQDNSDLSARTEYTEEDLSGSRRVRGKGSFYYKTNSIEMEILLCFFNQFNSIWQHKIIQYYSHDIHIFPFPFFASIPQAGWSW